MTIGSLTLTPTFDADVTEYTATTTNATNKITATATHEDASIEILVNNEELDNEGTATWDEGENTVEVTVSKEGSTSTTYAVTVTKTTQQAG